MLHLADSSGLLLRRHAVARGYDDAALRRESRAGRLVRIRQGVYCLGEVWESSEPARRHQLRGLGVWQLYGDDVALTHLTAAALDGCPVVGVDLEREDVHLMSLDGRGARRQAGVTHHRGQVLVGDVTRTPRGWLTTPTRTALDIARAAPRDTAVCVIDDLLHRRRTDLAQLDQRLAGMSSWPGALHARHVLSLVSGTSESPGESLCRLMFKDQRLPAPVPQYEIRDHAGRFIGRVDFAWPEHGVVVEFDGKSKYQQHRRAEERLEDCILREKRREDRVREVTGWTVIRLTWADLHSPARTTARLLAALARAAA